jgi:hypothetical protein
MNEILGNLFITKVAIVYATGTMDHQCSSGDPPTPITEVPSTPVSEEHDSHLITASL